jgi:hypothetical protein
MRTLSGVIILGIGFLLWFSSPARAQLGDMGEAVKKGAADAAKQELLKKAGLPTPEAAAATPAEEPKATPEAAEAPADMPGADTGAPNAPDGD